MATLGQQLKAAREAKGVSESDAGSATKILTKLIAAMEADDFSAMPAPTYAKGFIRLYAGYLGLDPEPLVDEYISRHAPGRRPLINEESQLEQNTRRPAPFAVNLKWLPVNLHPKAWLHVPSHLFSRIARLRAQAAGKDGKTRQPAETESKTPEPVFSNTPPRRFPALPVKDIRTVAGIVAALLVVIVLAVSISNCSRRKAADAPPAARAPESARMLLDEPLPDLYLVEPGKIESSR